MSVIENWSVPREWPGETVAILGGGPSLTMEQVEAARRFRRIAVNNAGLELDPDADALVWGDREWFDWNRQDLGKHRGRYKITWHSMPGTPDFDAGQPLANAGRIYVLQLASLERGHPPLAMDPTTVCGNNSGHGAINIAVHFGVKRILLLGFDMRPVNGRNNWHDRHRTLESPRRMGVAFRPRLEAAAPMLERLGIEVLNCTPQSALQSFPFADIRTVR